MKSLSLALLALVPLFAFAQNHAFVGNRFIVGDTAWFTTHIYNAATITAPGGSITKTSVDQKLFHHQYTTSHIDTNSVVVTVYDSIQIVITGDTSVVRFNSNNRADSAAAFHTLIYPLKALIGHPLTAFVHGKSVIDSIRGLDAAIHDASLKLNRSAAIAALKKAVNTDMVRDLMELTLANLPNEEMSDDRSDKFKRTRTVGKTPFYDDVVTQLMRSTADTAWLVRFVYTQLATPTFQYEGKACIIDSAYGAGDQQIVLDLPRGIVVASHETFSNFLRAVIEKTNTSVIQIDELKTDVELVGYSKMDRKATKKKK